MVPVYEIFEQKGDYSKLLQVASPRERKRKKEREKKERKQKEQKRKEKKKKERKETNERKKENKRKGKEKKINKKKGEREKQHSPLWMSVTQKHVIFVSLGKKSLQNTLIHL